MVGVMSYTHLLNLWRKLFGLCTIKKMEATPHGCRYLAPHVRDEIKLLVWDQNNNEKIPLNHYGRYLSD